MEYNERNERRGHCLFLDQTIQRPPRSLSIIAKGYNERNERRGRRLNERRGRRLFLATGYNERNERRGRCFFSGNRTQRTQGTPRSLSYSGHQIQRPPRSLYFLPQDTTNATNAVVVVVFWQGATANATVVVVFGPPNTTTVTVDAFSGHGIQ